ncbi:NAD-dependent epimerase/dehydratase family protein [Streptomyces mobaraensis NBRC 13819 = DSM 40847]|uniref:UDP-glucose 4-epimerase n=1 Tax=Streptomyces mobaraensis (strain ATCC 29032 / DSM 40847 / JCM 4168 / NBRC 13819 / NCIMB 11159 / IPCR 16-22) TaxID=1223523 RepID=M3BPH5_STRM1|nr:NAD-dependent epimerase/dehydratase family protein [Streptomyces mobaraensis]EMF01570.1 UDP-glucose 4-epimerase [Streptomyces mobaraensis NBRC 13819 = DSM 40847]QTT74960.1 NAD-dependent epimerase/dehydratase family protein [Streptomyces mobaraensis NBRC 13819 = DSM 40847]
MTTAHPLPGGRTAVIGATGFIGSRLTAALTAGDPRVPAAFNRAVPPVADGRAAPGLAEADIVYFLAAGLSPILAERRPDLVEAERRLLIEVLDALAAAGRRPVFVLAGSGGAVYAPEVAPPYRETTPTRPDSAYGHAKLRLEHELFRRRDAVRAVVARLSNVYGPGQRPVRGFGVLPHWLRAAVRGEPVRVFGDPHVVRDYVHVDDVTRFLLALRTRIAGGRLPSVVNIGSGVPTSLSGLLDIVSEVTGGSVAVRWERGRSFDRQGNWLDVARADAEFGWRAAIPLAEGVRACWERVLDDAGRAASVSTSVSTL